MSNTHVAMTSTQRLEMIYELY